MRLTAKDIEKLLPGPGHSGTPEGARLDYKSGMPSPWTGKTNGWEAKHECAKDVSALANHMGGHIVVGIKEDRTSDPPRSLPGKFTGVGGDNPEKQIKDWLHAALRPRELARRVDVYTLEVQGNTVVIVDVPAWDRSIALVEWGTVHDRLGYYAAIRDGDHTRYLDHREIEERTNHPLRAEIARLQAEGDVELAVVDIDADERGRASATVPQLRLEEELPAEFAMFAPMRLDGVVGPRRQDVERYLDQKSRAVWVRLAVENRGTARATDVEVRIDISNVENVRTSLRAPTRLAIPTPPMMDPNRNGTRNVTYESHQLHGGGAASATQRIKVIAPGSDAELVPFIVVVRSAKVLTFRVEATAIDSTGRRAASTFEHSLVRGKEEIVTMEQFR